MSATAAASSSSSSSTSTIQTNQIFQQGYTAVITGASSGIGRCASLECASKGMNVWMVDVDHDDLIKAKDHISSTFGNVFPGQVRKRNQDFIFM